MSPINLTSIIAALLSVVMLFIPYSADTPEKADFAENLSAQLSTYDGSQSLTATAIVEDQTYSAALAPVGEGYGLALTSPDGEIRLEADSQQAWLKVGGETWTMSYEDMQAVLQAGISSVPALDAEQLESDLNAIGGWLTDLGTRLVTEGVSLTRGMDGETLHVSIDREVLYAALMPWVDSVLADPAFDGMLTRFQPMMSLFSGAAAELTAEGIRADWAENKERYFYNLYQSLPTDLLKMDLALGTTRADGIGRVNTLNISGEIMGDQWGTFSGQAAWGSGYIELNGVASLGGFPLEISLHRSAGHVDGQLCLGRDALLLSGAADMEDGNLTVQGTILDKTRGSYTYEYTGEATHYAGSGYVNFELVGYEKGSGSSTTLFDLWGDIGHMSSDRYELSAYLTTYSGAEIDLTGALTRKGLTCSADVYTTSRRYEEGLIRLGTIDAGITSDVTGQRLYIKADKGSLFDLDIRLTPMGLSGRLSTGDQAYRLTADSQELVFTRMEDEELTLQARISYGGPGFNVVVTDEDSTTALEIESLSIQQMLNASPRRWRGFAGVQRALAMSGAATTDWSLTEYVNGDSYYGYTVPVDLAGRHDGVVYVSGVSFTPSYPSGNEFLLTMKNAPLYENNTALLRVTLDGTEAIDARAEVVNVYGDTVITARLESGEPLALTPLKEGSCTQITPEMALNFLTQLMSQMQ